MAQSPDVDGEPAKHDTEEVACPDCGVVQRATVWVQQYVDHPNNYFIDRECPICGFDDVWF